MARADRHAARLRVGASGSDAERPRRAEAPARAHAAERPRRTGLHVTAEAPPKVAILPWGDIVEDWLAPLGVSFDQFREHFVGSWMFGYAEALRTAGVATTIVCPTAHARRAERSTHGPTGVTIHLLPAPSPSRGIRRVRLDERLGARRDPAHVGRAVLTHVGPYLATPPVRLARVLRAERCTAVLCQEYETPRFDVTVVLGRLLGLPAYATFQGGDQQHSRFERPLRPLTIRRAAGLIIATKTESERVQRRYGVSERKIARIFNPIDHSVWRATGRRAGRAELGFGDDACVVAWHGQLHPRKGLDVLLEAWTRVCERRPGRPLELLVVGAGEAARSFEADVERLRAPRVRFVNEWVLDPTVVRRLLSSADVYAFPSRHEGFAVAPLEAMACGLPVVATDVQGVPDIFERGAEDGGLVVPRDDVSAFATALERLVDDAPYRRELGKRARARIEAAFSTTSVGAQLRSLLDARTAGTPATRSAAD